MRLFIALLLPLILFSPSADAHETIHPSASLLYENNVAQELWFSAAPVLLPELLNKPLERNQNGGLEWHTLQAESAAIIAAITNRLSISADEQHCDIQPLQRTTNAVALSQGLDGPLVTIGFKINCPTAISSLHWQDEPKLMVNARHANKTTVLGLAGELNLSNTQTKKQPVLSMLTLGFEHILEGYDHLLFLAVLLLAALPNRGSGRQRAKNTPISATQPNIGLSTTAVHFLKLATAFTVAHSFTLALAAIGLIRLPQQPVEVIIALSIIASVAVNYLRPSHTLQLCIVLLFGLVHGLGFSYNFARLLPTDLANNEFLAALALFNFGIELGQLLLACVVLPALVWAAKKWRGFSWFFHSAHLAILGVASYWVVERLNMLG